MISHLVSGLIQLESDVMRKIKRGGETLKKSLKEIRDELFRRDTGEVVKAKVNVRKISLESLGRSKPSSSFRWRKSLRGYFEE